MKTFIQITGAKGSGKTHLAELIKSLNPEKVLIADGMSVKEIEKQMTSYRKPYHKEVTPSTYEIAIVTDISFKDRFLRDVRDSNVFDNITEISIK